MDGSDQSAALVRQRDILPWWDLELRTTRRLTEIRDAQLALRTWFDPAVAQQAHLDAAAAGLHGIAAAAYVEVRRIAAALHAHTLGRTYAETSPEQVEHSGNDAASELEFLAQVARAYTALPPSYTVNRDAFASAT